MTFKISSSLEFPEESVTWVNSFLAKRGAGKTYSAAVLAEEMLKAKVPIIVIDGMGIWWGLRTSYDGKSDGHPIIVFGGEHPDIALNPLKIKDIARSIIESNVNAVIDVSNFSKTQARKIVQEFLDEVYKINRVERHVFIEEADLWAPQRTIGPEQAMCLSAVDNFVRRGGNHNLGCSLITQRSAVLNKDLLTQSDTLVILRTLAPQDKSAIQAWVDEQTDSDKRQLKEWYDSLKSLGNGEAWVWHPEHPEIFKKVQFRKRETFHATREFLLKPESRSVKLMDIGEFISKFKDKFEPKPKEVKMEEKVPVQIVERETAPIAPAEQYLVPARQRDSQGGISADAGDTVTVRQSLPQIVLEKIEPKLTVLSEPTTPLGKVLVVLFRKYSGHHDRWSRTIIKNMVEQHGWTSEGVDEEITRLIQWEVLVVRSNGQIRFNPTRVQVVQKAVDYEVR